MKLALSAALIAVAALAAGCATTDPAADGKQAAAEPDNKVRTGSHYERWGPTGRSLRSTSGQAYKESDRTSVITAQDPRVK